jgi:spore coat protein U-like protein
MPSAMLLILSSARAARLSKDAPASLRRSALSLVAAAILVLSPPARLQGLAAQMQSCTISVTPLRFGTYDPRQPGDLMMTGSVVFNCTLSQPVSIFLDQGNGRVAGMRRLANGKASLPYQIYFDATATRIWGDGSGGSQFYSNPAPPPRTNVIVPFYARIPARQTSLARGGYDDRIIVRITY